MQNGPSGNRGDMKNTPNARNSVSRFVSGSTRVKTPAELKLSVKNEGDLTPPDRRRLNVLRETGSLQSLPSEGKAPEWTCGNTDLLSRNLETLLGAARYPPGAIGTAMTENEKTSPESPFKRGKKRARPDDHDDYKEELTPNPERTATPSTTAVAAKPELKRLPKLPMNHIAQVKSKVDLAKVVPTPLRISYKAHPLEERTDAWYTEIFRRLFRQTHRFVSQYYGIHNINSGDFYEPWAVNMAPEFVVWAEQVAEPDPNLGTWDDLLRHTEQRKWFVMAIVMKILKIKVFDADLFGASQEQAELLHVLSKALIGREGFSRNALRTETVRTIIGCNAVTENFYPSVATLTTQIYLLLKPLTDYLYSMQPCQGASPPKITDQYQALHNLVSTAAYLSLCIRMSPTIFSIKDVSPGTLWDDADHHSLEDILYLESKETVLANFTKKHAAWESRRMELDTELEAIDTTRKVMTHTADALLSSHLAAEPVFPSWDYRPMTKIGVWPIITRYKPRGDEVDEKESCSEYLREDGFRIWKIAKGAVIVYFGWNGKDANGRLAPNPRGEKKSLRLWIQEKGKEREKAGGKGLGERGNVVATFGAAMVGVMMLSGYGMLNESFPMVREMEYVEAARYLACEVLRLCV